MLNRGLNSLLKARKIESGEEPEASVSKTRTTPQQFKQ